MAGRGPMSFQKRQKELKRKEKREEKLARKVAEPLHAGLGLLRDAEVGLGFLGDGSRKQPARGKQGEQWQRPA